MRESHPKIRGCGVMGSSPVAPRGKVQSGGDLGETSMTAEIWEKPVEIWEKNSDDLGKNSMPVEIWKKPMSIWEKPPSQWKNLGKASMPVEISEKPVNIWEKPPFQWKLGKNLNSSRNLGKTSEDLGKPPSQ